MIKISKKKSKRKNKKKNKFIALKRIFALAIIIVIVLTAFVIRKIYIEFSKINFEDVNKEDLAVNSNIYNDISKDLSKNEFSDIKTIVLFGVDSGSNDFSGRADTILVISVNPVNKGISLISIPRDTYVNIPGYGKDKINHSYAFGKEQLAIKTINQNFGLNITEYVTIDFAGLIKIINQIGGVTVNISKEEMDYINDSVQEAYDISGNKMKKLDSYGTVKLNGEQALTHSRNRTVGDDFVRASRQRNVLEALMKKMSTLDPISIMNLSDDLLSEFKTNINVLEYVGNIISVVSNKNTYINNVTSVQVPAAEYSLGKIINGTYYFTTVLNKAKADFIKYIYRK